MQEHIKLNLWLFSYVKPYTWFLILLVFCNVTISIGDLGILKTIELIVDSVTEKDDIHYFKILILSAIIILLLKLVAMTSKNLLERIIREYAARDIQYACLKHFQKLGVGYIDQHPSGETLTILQNDVAAVQNIYRTHLPAILSNFIILAFTMIFTLTIHLKLTILSFSSFLVVYFIGDFFDEKVSKWARLRIDGIRQWNKKLYDSLSGIIELRAFGSEKWDLARFKSIQDNLNFNYLRAKIYITLRGVIRSGATVVSLIIILIYAPNYFILGEITVGQFTIYILCFLNLSQALANIINSIVESNLLQHQAVRIKKFIETQPIITEITEPIILSSIKGDLEFNNISFGYKVQQPPIIDQLNLKVKAGERIAIVGSSGEGKTTLLKLIGRFYDPNQGEIKLDGVPLQKLSLEQIRQSIGYVFQETYIFGTTVLENIRFGNIEASDEQVVMAAKAAKAHEFIINLPEGYNTYLTERGVNLSGGQKQRIAIARMLIKNPKIVILDEATSSIDNINEVSIRKELDLFFKMKTIITVAHKLSTVIDYDRIIVMHRGKVAEMGTYVELMRKQGRFYKSQIRFNFQNSTGEED